MTSRERTDATELHRTLDEVSAYLQLAHEHDAGCAGHDRESCAFCDAIEYAGALLKRTATMVKEVKG